MADTEENRLALAKYEAITAECYKEPTHGKYQDTTAAILAGLGSELEADVELSGCSLELESELGQEKAQPTTEELGTKSGLDEEGIDASDKVCIDVSDGEGTDGSDRAQCIRRRRDGCVRWRSHRWLGRRRLIEDRHLRGD